MAALATHKRRQRTQDKSSDACSRSDSEDDADVPSQATASNYSTPTKKKKSKWYFQHFNQEWLQHPSLKDWLQVDPDDKNSAMCKVCNTKFKFKNSNKTALLAHKDSKKHQKNFRAKQQATHIQSFFKSEKKTLDLKDKVAKAEVLLVGFMVEHQMPFRQVDHLTETLKAMFPDCTTAQNMSLKHTKATYIMQEGIACSERQDLSDICKSQKFSILIDESTDISTSQVLAVVVRYFDEKTQNVVDALLDTVEVEDGSGQGLYKEVKALLTKHGIPMSNVIGFGSDNCSTMMGSKCGFQAQLKNDVPSVFVMGCVCHSFALCANHASKFLPSWLELFLKRLTAYFARSSKRQSDFHTIQIAVNVAEHKILKLSQTRWLSRGKVIERVLEQWEALTLFFQSESVIDKTDGAGEIYNVMKTAGTYHMLTFLNYILKKVDAMNLLFQSESFQLHKLYTTVCGEYRNILGMFIRDDVLCSKPLSTINPLNSDLYKELTEVHLGGRCEGMLLKETLGNQEKRFKSDCLLFLSQLASEIRKRFP